MTVSPAEPPRSHARVTLALVGLIVIVAIVAIVPGVVEVLVIGRALWAVQLTP